MENNKEKEGQREERKHALLSASSSHRWLECTPSAIAESAYPDKGSDFAREGSLAHAIGAWKLKYRLGLDHSKEEAEIRELEDEFYSGEMDEHTDGYANYVMERYAEAGRRARAQGTAKPEIRIEAQLDYADWVPDGFGTGDAVIIGGGMMEIIDLKYGKGVKVSAEHNTQLMLYALGAGILMDYAYDIHTVRMTIYQPRLGNLSEWEIPAGELTEWAERILRPLAGVAALGLGARKSGPWCKFCKAKGDCARYASDMISIYSSYPADVPQEKLPEILGKLPLMKDWISTVEQRSLDLALSGVRIEGYKLVAGRSVRQVTDPVGAAAALMAAGAEEDQVWRPRELRTLGDLEKAFGKKRFATVCGEYIEKRAGKPTLVPDSDKRDALNPSSDFDGFDLD